MFYDRVKLTAANYGSTKRVLTTTSAWLYPSKVQVEVLGDITTAHAPKVFKVVTGTTPSTNEVEFAAPSSFTFGTGITGSTVYSVVDVFGCPRGSGSSVA